MWRRDILLATIFALCMGEASAENKGDAQTPDVMVAVTQFGNDLETVRLHMGKPAVVPDSFPVEFAAPRHDFFQAQTLKNIFPAHVYAKAASIREQLNHVLDGL